MTREAKWRKRFLYFSFATAIGIALAFIFFLGFILSLRTEYHATRLEINEAVLQTDIGSGSIKRGSESWPLSRDVLEYINRQFLGDGMAVFNRKGVEPDENSIWLCLGKETLCLTAAEDSSVIHLSWSTPEAKKTYSLRGPAGCFRQANAYLTRYIGSIS